MKKSKCNLEDSGMEAGKQPKNIEDIGFNFLVDSVFPKCIIETIKNFVFKCDRCPSDFNRFLLERLSFERTNPRISNTYFPNSFLCKRCWQCRRCDRCKCVLPNNYEYLVCDGCAKEMYNLIK